MYKVVIVDDEKPIVQGLKAFIDWEASGFSVVGTAFNGEQGVMVAKETQADVVLTDIRMPLLSGHDLIDRIKEFNPACKFIVLSGYSNFKYAQEAVNRGAFCYLLKPVQEKELKKNLAAIKAELDLKNIKQQELSRLKEQLRESLPVVRERYLCDMVRNEAMTPDQIRKKWDFLNLGYSLDTFAVLVLEGDGLEQKYGDDISQILLIRFAITNIVEDMVNEAEIGVTFCYSQDRTAILCCQKDAKPLTSDRILKFAQSVQKVVSQVLKESVCIGVGRIYSSASSLCRSFQEAERAIKYKLLYGPGSLISFEEIPEETQRIDFPLQLEQELLSYVEMGHKEETAQALHRIFSYLTSSGSYMPETIYNICLNFVITVSRCAILCGVPYQEIGIDSHTFLQELLQFKTISELENHLEQMILGTTDKIHALRLKKQRGTLGKIQEYIEKHYQDDLSLDFLAKKFFINPSYLSQLFKKELGSNFVDFLTGIRVENSKRLLLDPELKIYEIGLKVGYGNPKYFSQIFEKITGLTPSEYRKKIFESQ